MMLKNSQMSSAHQLFARNIKEYSVKFAKLSWTLAKFYSFAYVCKTYLIPIDLVVCRGGSMEPMLMNNDIVLTEKVSVRRQRLKQ